MNKTIQSHHTQTALELPAPAEAAAELCKLDSLIRERATIRAAREAELRELLGTSGGADAIDRVSDLSADVLRLSAALDIESRALTGARARIAVLCPIVCAEVARLGSEIEAAKAASHAGVRRRAEAQIAPFFPADAVPAISARSNIMRAESEFAAAHNFGSGGLSYQFGPGGAVVLADDVQPVQVVHAYRNGLAILASVTAHLREVEARYA